MYTSTMWQSVSKKVARQSVQFCLTWEMIEMDKTCMYTQINICKDLFTLAKCQTSSKLVQICFHPVQIRTCFSQLLWCPHWQLTISKFNSNSNSHLLISRDNAVLLNEEVELKTQWSGEVALPDPSISGIPHQARNYMDRQQWHQVWISLLIDTVIQHFKASSTPFILHLLV